MILMATQYCSQMQVLVKMQEIPYMVPVWLKKIGGKQSLKGNNLKPKVAMLLPSHKSNNAQ